MIAHYDFSSRAGCAKEVERTEKWMQQRRVVGIADVLTVQLPVRLRILAGAPEVCDWLMEDPVEPAAHLRADVIIERWCTVAEGRKHQAPIAVDPQLLEAVVFRIEIGRHPRRSFHAIA